MAAARQPLGKMASRQSSPVARRTFGQHFRIGHLPGPAARPIGPSRPIPGRPLTRDDRLLVSLLRASSLAPRATARRRAVAVREQSAGCLSEGRLYERPDPDRDGLRESACTVSGPKSRVVWGFGFSRAPKPRPSSSQPLAHKLPLWEISQPQYLTWTRTPMLWRAWETPGPGLLSAPKLPPVRPMEGLPSTRRSRDASGRFNGALRPRLATSQRRTCLKPDRLPVGWARLFATTTPQRSMKGPVFPTHGIDKCGKAVAAPLYNHDRFGRLQSTCVGRRLKPRPLPRPFGSLISELVRRRRLSRPQPRLGPSRRVPLRTFFPSWVAGGKETEC